MTNINFRFEGEQVRASKGDSIAAALLNAGKLVLGERINGQPRGAYCGMGICSECLVTINGQRGLRACLQVAEPGLVVEKEADQICGQISNKMVNHKRSVYDADILIVGAGPAGLKAAIESSRAGLNVIVLDEREESGGQYFKARTEGYRGKSSLDRQHRVGIKLRNAAEEAGVKFYSGQTVWYARKNDRIFEVRCSSNSKQLQIFSPAVILCTGAFEVPVVVPGWTLPGVVTIGAAQTMVRRYGVVPKGRVLVAGNGPLGLQLVHEMLSLGKSDITLVERAKIGISLSLFKAAFYSPSLIIKGLNYRWSAAKNKVPLKEGWEIEKILGSRRVEGVVLSNLSSDKKYEMAVDYVAAGDGFTPQTELSRLLGVSMKIDPITKQVIPIRRSDCSTEISNLWIAGDAGGMGGADLAAVQGEIAALGAIEKMLAKPKTKKWSYFSYKARKASKFQSALWSIYNAPKRTLSTQDLIVCRCEQIPAEQIVKAINAGSEDLSSIKRKTRLGMGRCQGRYCIPPVIKYFEEKNIVISSDHLFAPQIPARPIRASAIWQEKPEWKGHRETPLPIRPQKLSQKPLARSNVDLVVIGAGITGIASAYFAAKEGASVICLEKGLINSEASGGNAGSLHVQLLSWDFGLKAVGEGELQLRTLPLQKESVSLWRKLQKDFKVNFEMEFTGGLMVAENEDQVQFLEDKVKAEARFGVETKIIDKEQIAKIVPEISDAVVAGSWCEDEGKINPLLATPILANEAKKVGAIIEELTQVNGLQKERCGYEVKTNRGVIKAKKVIVAAGGWSSEIFQMLGIGVPIKGAPLQMLVTTPSPQIVNCLMYHAGRHLTLKQTKTGSVIIGGAWPANVSEAGATVILPESVEGNLWAAGQTIPRIGDLQILRSWGAMNIDIDGAPLLGSIPGHEGLIVAATANGYTLGPLMGREAANLVFSGNLRQDLQSFSLDRFN